MRNWIKHRFRKQGYEYYDNPRHKYRLNIFAVRTNSQIVNTFDDFLYITYYDNLSRFCIKQYACTTDPGLYYLKNPSTVRGTAILVPDQYQDAYNLDLHRGKYLALCQRRGKVKVYRDYNRNNRLDFDNATIEEDFFGINIHAGGREYADVDYAKVHNISAGCTALAKRDEYKNFINLCKKHEEFYGNTFTFTLFTERQFNTLR